MSERRRNLAQRVRAKQLRAPWRGAPLPRVPISGCFSGGLGDFASSALAALQQAGGALGTGAKVVSDPYLPEVLCRVDQLAQIEAGQRPTPCVAMAPGRAGGVGLRKVVEPLRAYVYAEQHPWVYPLAIGAAVGIPFLLGYLAGK